MASLNDLYDLIDQNIPSATRAVTAANLRAVLYAMSASNAGQSSVSVLVNNNTTSITSAALIGKTVTLIVGDGFTKTTGFTQPNGSGNITFTDGTTLSMGNVTIFFS